MNMKIATWNIERPTKTGTRIQHLINCLKEIDADILILTESHEGISLGDDYNYFHTDILKETFYKEGEKRTSIYSKYPLIDTQPTFRADTSICTKLKTPYGDLAVYGTVIGINGNRRKSFDADLVKQLEDFEKISANENLCIGGDLNMSFSDNYYYTQEGRLKLNNSFNKLKLTNLTAGLPENIDHIIISDAFMKGKFVKISEWNRDKKLSDHIGVCVTITETESSFLTPGANQQVPIH